MNMKYFLEDSLNLNTKPDSNGAYIISLSKVKDNLEYTTLLLTSGLLDSLKKLQAGIDKMTTEMEERTYKPRVLNELFDNENPDD